MSHVLTRGRLVGIGDLGNADGSTRLAAACGACNGSKGNRAPKEWAAGICAPKGVR